MMSIHRRLLLELSLGLLFLFLVSGTIFYVCIRVVLVRQFDAALVAQADAIGSLVMRQPNGEVELELSQRPASPFSADGHLDYFQIWREDGSVLARSSALGKSDLPRFPAANGPRFGKTTLPDGHPGRVVQLRIVPGVEDEDAVAGSNLEARVPRPPAIFATVAVAQDRSELDRIMGLLLSALLVAAVCIVGGSVAVVSVAVRRGLGPLQQVAREVAQIDAQSLDYRFSSEGLPSELQPVGRRLNESLERLQQSFQRERRFAANVSHELRTPIAELRSLADVALKWDGDREKSLAYFRDAREIARQMEKIVTTLLSLARCQSGTLSVQHEPVNVGGVVKEAWESCEQRAAKRSLAVTFAVPAGVVVHTDRTMLHSILSNVLANAVEYATSGGTVSCKAEGNHSTLKISVVNDTDLLSAEDVSHLFEAFWRKDPARTDNSHCGLGLTLVDAYARMLGGKVHASLATSHKLCVAIHLPIIGQQVVAIGNR